MRVWGVGGGMRGGEMNVVRFFSVVAVRRCVAASTQEVEMWYLYAFPC